MLPSKTKLPMKPSPISNLWASTVLSNVILVRSKVTTSSGIFVCLSTSMEPLPISSPNGYLARLTRPVGKLKGTG